MRTLGEIIDGMKEKHPGLTDAMITKCIHEVLGGTELFPTILELEYKNGMFLRVLEA